ncbi:hypothetical protein [Parasutterella excrementihominis]|uniref:hypothetical protein n=1 Tax=Parasutterella excrementihominis TaxID=487175 RepID=UPI003FEE0EFE
MALMAWTREEKNAYYRERYQHKRRFKTTVKRKKPKPGDSPELPQTPFSALFIGVKHD